jgi:hypothetical protein
MFRVIVYFRNLSTYTGGAVEITGNDRKGSFGGWKAEYSSEIYDTFCEVLAEQTALREGYNLHRIVIRHEDVRGKVVLEAAQLPELGAAFNRLTA